jgi:predicted phosphodiesterase
MCVGAQAADREPLFRFAHFSDVHYVSTYELADPKCRYHKPIGGRVFAAMPKMVPKAVAMARQQGVAFALITGDALETMQQAGRRWEELRSHFGSMPVHVAPGNHDIGLEQLATPMQSDYHFVCGGLRFVVVRSFSQPGVRPIMAREALENLARMLDRHPNEPVVVLMHSPLVTGPSWAPPVNHAVVRRVLEKPGNVIAVLAGHIHEFTSQERNGIRYVTAPGFVDKPGHPFFVWSVFRDRLAMRAVSTTGLAEHRSHKLAAMKVSVPVPDRFRAKLRAPAPPDLAHRPAPSLLNDWFGPDFETYPGSRPKQMANARVVLARGAKGWRVWVADKRNASPGGKDKAGWTRMAYDDSTWRAIDLPAGYGPHAIPKVDRLAELPKSPGSYFFRTTVELDTAGLGARGLLRVASDKAAVVYVNGKRIDSEPAHYHHRARYWNRYVWFDPGVLRPGRNLIAVKLHQRPSSHAFLDLAIGVAAKK